MDGELMAKCECSRCGNHIEFPMEGAGAVIDCPHCGEPTQLSLTAPAPGGGPGRLSAAELMAAFSGPVPRTPVSVYYQAGLILVTLMMVLLPLFYLGLIAGAAYGVYYYATHFTFLLKPPFYVVYVFLLKVFCYVAPLFAGVVLVFFMIKPLLARRSPGPQPLALNPALAPELYAFIARICDLVGAPMPRRIDLVCEINAAAGFRRGLSSLFKDDLVLTIGLPLVAGLNLRQFAGVMAHEFGHLTQGFGMRLSYVVRSLNGWFARVVYERDAWDVWMAEWSAEEDDLRVLLVVTCARVAVGFSRLLLMLLMFLAHGVSCFMMRQMEYDADSYEIKLAGSATFESTTKRMAVLGEALGRAYKDARTTWNLSRRLPDDFPAYIVLQDSKIPPAVRTRIEDTLGLNRTRLFDTHPSEGDRIRRARRAGEPGVFHLELPASTLFPRFDVVSKQITNLHYAEDLDLAFDGANLRPVEAMPASGDPRT